MAGLGEIQLPSAPIVLPRGSPDGPLAAGQVSSSASRPVPALEVPGTGKVYLLANGVGAVPRLPDAV